MATCRCCGRWPSGASPGSRWPGSRAGPPSATSPCWSMPGSTSPAGRAWSWPGAPTARLPENGKAVDLCTGSGAVAAALGAARPSAAVVGTDNDARAVACARANGVEAYRGDLFAAVPASFRTVTDVVVAVVPYVPSIRAASPPPRHARVRGCLALRRRPGRYRRAAAGRHGRSRLPAPGRGACCSSSAATQAEVLRPTLDRLGYTSVRTWSDEDGDLRGLEATLG